jgi:hypothetical protein
VPRRGGGCVVGGMGEAGLGECGGGGWAGVERGRVRGVREGGVCATLMA